MRAVLKQECSDLDAAVYKGGKVPLRKHPRRGLAIAALVLGICSCVFFNITCGVLAIVFGAMAKASREKRCIQCRICLRDYRRFAGGAGFMRLFIFLGCVKAFCKEKCSTAFYDSDERGL